MGDETDRKPAGDRPMEEGTGERRLSRAGLLKAAGATAAGAMGAMLLGNEGRAEAAGDGASDSTIVRCAIHPGIGIARAGNSPHEYFIGPEVPGVAPDAGGSYKDAAGRIKRQAARFRLYGLNAAGRVVKELTADNADITWTVHLANKKAAWYQFQLALDIPEASSPSLPPSMRALRRNPAVRGKDRRRLIIDGGSRSIRGKGTHGPAHRFDAGSFLGRRVSLGELRTGSAGHLLVLGGLGTSGTTLPNNQPRHIANNDGWYDDLSDGPVTARVTIHGKPVPVTPAWVIVAPPAYAPGILPVVTLYDIAYGAYLEDHPHQPKPVSFTRDIYPILERFDRLQWVNQGFFQGYGWGGQVPFLDPALLAQLASNDPGTAAVRQRTFSRFRDPSYKTMREDAWPRLYGDNFAQPPQTSRQYLSLTREQYRRLREWAAGNFAADWDPNASPPQSLADLPLAARPAALDRAALESCSGGPFHPGEEAPWIMRHPSMYMGLCRLRPRLPGEGPEPDYGDVLTPARALGADGPLHRSGPGDITRWMAVPWQTDTANCGSAYPNSTLQPYPLPDLPSFWPALVPNRVLIQAAYQRILDTSSSPADRGAAFQQRDAWMRHLPSGYLERNNQIVTDWYRLGFITPQSGPGDAAFPDELYVETDSGFPETAHAWATQEVEGAPSAPLLRDRRAHL